jgi:hypothetical protein
MLDEEFKLLNFSLQFPPYPKSDQSSPHHYILSLQDTS